MAMNRVQFQPGLSLPAFLRRYGTEAACTAALQQARWPNGYVCPKCAATRCSQFIRRSKSMWQCSACRHQTSLRAGTVFDNTKLPLTTWLLALYLLSQSKTNLSALELMRPLGVCYRTAWRLKHKLMQAMNEREAPRRLGGLVQIDDAYLGGERNGGKAGRGFGGVKCLGQPCLGGHDRAGGVQPHGQPGQHMAGCGVLPRGEGDVAAAAAERAERSESKPGGSGGGKRDLTPVGGGGIGGGESGVGFQQEPAQPGEASAA